MKIENAPLLEYTATSSYASLQKATEAMCKHRSKQGNIGLNFSLFETNKEKDKGLDSGDWIVKHPDIWSDEPVFPNQVVFYSNYWRISDEQINSEIMTNPRWRDIICEANRQLIDNSDGSTACLFLEGFRELDARPSDGVTFIELVWGS
jgi:hypothetical protein